MVNKASKICSEYGFNGDVFLFTLMFYFKLFSVQTFVATLGNFILIIFYPIEKDFMQDKARGHKIHVV